MESMLVEKSINGDIESFEQLISKYNQYVYNISYRMMGNAEDAQDMSQEALIKAYKSIKNFRNDANFSTWLYRIVINTCKDELRKKSEPTLSMDQEGVANLLSDEQDDPIIVYEKNELKVHIQKALDQLSVDGRTVVVLKDLMGYSYEEIGNILEIPTGTVRSRLHRNRINLKDILKATL